MFGITPIGWLHTLSSIPAIPAAAYMLVKHGRIVPRSKAGTVYFISMLIGSVTVFLVTHIAAGYVIGTATLLFLFAGYGAGRVAFLGRAAKYIETICLSLTAFLLMLPTVSEILRRVPNGHPWVTDPKAPLFLCAQAVIFLTLIIGLAAQLIFLRRSSKLPRAGVTG